MKKKLLYLLVVTLVPVSFVNADLTLGTSDVTLESVYRKLEDEDSRSNSQQRGQLNLTIGQQDQRGFLDDTYLVDVNLVFEDGEEVKGQVSASFMGTYAEYRYIEKGYRLGTVSIEQPDGLLEELVDTYEREAGKAIVRVDVASVIVKLSSLGQGSPGVSAEGSIGLGRVSAQVGLAFASQKMVAQLSANVTRERGEIFDKDSKLNYGLYGVEGKLVFYFTDNLQAEIFARHDTIEDMNSDSKYKESRLSTGARVRFLFARE